jgi:hypothetical protein
MSALVTHWTKETDLTLAQWRKWAAVRVEALNHALRNISRSPLARGSPASSSGAPGRVGKIATVSWWARRISNFAHAEHRSSAL